MRTVNGGLRQTVNTRIEHRPVFDNDLPGGNGEAVGWDEAHGALKIRPELKDGSPYRAWFFFRLRHLIPGRTYTLGLVENYFAGIYSYTYAMDGPWRQFASCRKDANTDFTFTIEPSRDTLYVAMMPPYRLEHLQRLIQELTPGRSFSAGACWSSEEGRAGMVLRVCDHGDRPGLFRVWITARMHGFEAVSSWVAEGLVRWAVSPDPDAQWLRGSAELFVAPLVDVDSVERGGTGKHRAPICFARDAGHSPHWKAIRSLVQTWKEQGPPDIHLDLHGPGGDVEDIYFYAPETKLTSPKYEADLARFAGILAETRLARISFNKRMYRCPLGPDYLGQDMAGTSYLYLHRQYFGENRLKLALGIETPWGMPGYDTEAFLQCGADYGRTISRFLRDSSPIHEVPA